MYICYFCILPVSEDVNVQLSHVQFFVIPWTVAHQAPLSFQARILEWVAISFSRGLFPTQGSISYLLCLWHWQAGSLPLLPLESHIRR